MMRTLVITDNAFLLKEFVSIIDKLQLINLSDFHYMCSPNNKILVEQGCKEINLKHEWLNIIPGYFDLVISLHCKQLFPKDMVSSVRCVNIHPGYNPYNRGWYPQVFSILNKLPLGATIHVIDAELDHGPIIAQKQIEVLSTDTSFTAYNRVLGAELVLITEHIKSILINNYVAKPSIDEGNLNLKKDFNVLLKIDLDETVRVGDFIDRLRALTHGEYNNAYFEDENGDFLRHNEEDTREYGKLNLQAT
ncbi:MAG: dTDP-4-amino-4,6-dideoxyglucose formyltransferase [Sphingobacteriaceae bacterium]|nr:MAG: dTDP-4-amino-4,6-dideoxyglucose formyltransferase [Sphingobacteriaceae bacterium]